MIAAVCSVLAGVLVHMVVMTEPKEVNITLETVLRFDDKKDPTQSLAVIDKVQDALEKIKGNLKLRSGRRSNTRDMTLSDFISKAAKILRDYNDTALEDVFAVIHDESLKFLNREELVEGNDARRHLSEKLDLFKDLSANSLRRRLDNIVTAVEMKKKTGEKNDLIDIASFLYLGASHKFKSALRNLDKLKKTKGIRVEDVLKDTLRSLIFDHYSNLNSNIKREVIEMAKDYWRMYGDKRKHRTGVSQLEPDGVTRFHHEVRKKHSHAYRSQLNNASNIQLITTQTFEFHKSYHKNRIHKNENKTTTINADNKTSVTVSEDIEKLSKSESAEEISSKSSEYQNAKIKTTTNKLPNTSLNPPLAISITLTPPLTIETKKNETKPSKTDPEKLFLLNGGQFTKDVGLKEHAYINNSEHSQTTEDYDKSDDYNSENNTFSSNEKITTETDAVRRNRINLSKSVTQQIVREITTPSLDINDTTRESIESGEGMTIESFENKHHVENKENSRKQIKHDKLDLDNFYMKNMIRNIENQIKDVREQVAYVKNMSLCTSHKSSSSSKVKSPRSNKTSSSKSPKVKSKTYRSPDSDSLERDNEAFISLDILENVSKETKVSSLGFRAHDNATANKTTLSNFNETKSTILGNISTEKGTIATIAKLDVTEVNTDLTSTSMADKDKTNLDIVESDTQTTSAVKATRNTTNVEMMIKEVDRNTTALPKSKEDQFQMMPRRVMDIDLITNELPPEFNLENLPGHGDFIL